VNQAKNKNKNKAFVVSYSSTVAVLTNKVQNVEVSDTSKDE
jgi:hypothetical protein